MIRATTRFEAHRRRQIGIAYRMLGCRADAEDVVQDAWIKWSQVDLNAIECDEAFLTTLVTRLCLDKIRQERVRRQAYVGPWLPEPIADACALGSHTASELADDLSYALLLALERLSALERAAFLLHDVFDVPFSEIAAILERNEAAVRQLATRARKAVREARPARPAPPEKHRDLLTAFMKALGEGNANQLKALLREDAVFVSDGGGKKSSALRPVQGADNMTRLLMGLVRKQAPQDGSISVVDMQLNGTPGLLVYINKVLEQTFTISVDDGLIVAVYAVRNPEKLDRLGNLNPGLL